MSTVAVTCSCCSMSVDWWVRLRSHPDLPICHDCLAGLNGQRDGQLQFMTGHWLVTGFEPIFKVADLARSVAWFERAGFEVSIHDDFYAFAHRDRDLTIHLARTQVGEPAGRLRSLPPLPGRRPDSYGLEAGWDRGERPTRRGPWQEGRFRH